MKKTVMPKQAAPVERNSPATAGAAGAECNAEREGGVGPCWSRDGFTMPFAGDDAE